MTAIAAPSPLTSQVKPNIFSTPLKAKTEATLAVKKVNLQKAYLYLGVTIVMLAAYSFTFFYSQLNVYLGFGKQIQAVQDQVSNYDVKLSDLEKVKETHKSAYDESFKEEQKTISAVFPDKTDKLGVIRLMENFATHLNTVYPPFELNSISFGEAAKKGGYTILPFNTSVTTSRANFDRFLGLVNLSGDFNPKNPDHIRLLDISNITVRYRGADATGKDQGVDFSVKLNAYSK